MMPNSYPALLLNADGQPMSVFPMSLLGWQDCIIAVKARRVVVVAEYDQTVHSGINRDGQRGSHQLSSVVMSKVYRNQNRPVAFTRAGVLLRAKGLCAYCHAKLTMRDLTFDHVVPQCEGGATTWMNCVASCRDCNARKGNRSLAEIKREGMVLIDLPTVPNRAQLNGIALEHFPVPSSRLHPSWLDYLGVSGANAAAELAQASSPQGVVPAFPAEMTSEQYWHAELES